MEGEIASWASRKIFKFKPELTTAGVEFTEMSSMNVGRNYPALAVCDGQIYGKNNDMCNVKCECLICMMIRLLSTHSTNIDFEVQ